MIEELDRAIKAYVRAIAALVVGVGAIVLVGPPHTAHAQGTISTIAVRKQTTLSAAAEVVTVQQPGSNSRNVRFLGAYFDCNAACAFTLERNGTAATTTSLTPQNVNPAEPLPATVAFSASNVGAGTIIGSYTCSAACQIPLDLTGIFFPAGTTGSTNLTLRSGSMTGTVDILFKYQETQQ